MTHICVSKLSTIGSNYDLSPARRKAIISTNAGILLIWTIRTNFNENVNRNSYIFSHENPFENVVCELRPFCLGLNVLTKCTIMKTTSCTSVQSPLNEPLWRNIKLMYSWYYDFAFTNMPEALPNNHYQVHRTKQCITRIRHTFAMHCVSLRC